MTATAATIQSEKWQGPRRGFPIAGKFLFAAIEPNKKLINLSAVIWIDTRYKNLDYQLIDYPGEYDIQGMTIKCFLGKGDKLNYVIDLDKKIIWIFQSPEVLENDEVGVVNERFYTDDRVAKKIDQMELEGEQKKLED